MARNSPLELVPSQGSRSLAMLDDDELMILVQGGHAAALGTIVDRHQAAVVGFARCYLGDESLISDVAQEVFLALWTQARRYRPKGTLKSYLLSIARNHCRMAARGHGRELRKRDALRVEGQAAPASEPGAIEDLLAQERRRQVRLQLLELPEKEREVLILRYHSALSLEEIAELLEMPVGTVKSCVYRGLRRLRQGFGERP